MRYNAELPPDVIAVLKVFKNFVWKYVICDVNTQRIEYKGQRMLREMFQVFANNPERLLPPYVLEQWRNADEAHKQRVVCDYIASMSDANARRLYQQL